jgi:hypothetical protein
MLPRVPCLIAVSVLLSNPAFGNCEVGGYSIHTIAEYKPYEVERSLLPYWKETPTGIGIEPNWIDDLSKHLPALQSPGLRLVHGDRSCSGTTLSLRDRYVDPHELRLDAPLCGNLLENLPSHGYAILDGNHHTLRFMDALPIDIVDLASQERAVLEAEVRARLSGLTLYAESFGEERARIEAAEVVSSRMETTTVGFGPPPFTMVIAVLELRNLDRLYRDGGRGYAPGFDVTARLAGRSIDYPVIFFRTRAGGVRYVGDGSLCATPSVVAAAVNSGPRDPLGAVARFRITGAFDGDSDGTPDVLEINDRFAYLLERDGSLFVIRVGVGC